MLLFYLFFPFFGFLLNLRFVERFSRIGFLNLAFWFGYSVFFTEGDITYYYFEFQEIVRYDFDKFFHIVSNLYDEDEKLKFVRENVYNAKPDVYVLTVSFIISRFTENARVFFAFVSVIYFFLQMKFLTEVLKMVPYNLSRNWIIFFVFLASIVPFHCGVTGIRFWTALFLFLWILAKYFNTRQTYYLYFMVFAPLIHYTFFFPILMVLLSFVLRIKRRLLKFLIIFSVIYATLAVSTNLLSFITDAIALLDNESISNSSASYLDEDKLAERKIAENTGNWYVKGRMQAINLLFLLFYLYDFIKIQSRTMVQNRVFFNLYHLSFVISVITLNAGSIARFIYIFYFMVLIRLLYIHVHFYGKKLSLWGYLTIPVLILHILVTFRGSFYFVDPLLLVSPSPYLLFMHSNVSLSQLLIGH